MKFLKWLASLFGGQSNIQIGKNNPNAQTRDNSPVRQATIGKVGGDASIGADAESIALGTVDRAFQASAALVGAEREQSLMLSEEVGRLKEQLASARQRAEEAESRGVAGAKDAVEQLKQSGNTARLLAFLLAQEKAAKEDLVALRREIAAVAYLRGKIDIAEWALKDILRVLPDDLDALNRMGHIHNTCDRLDKAMANYRRVLDLATKQENQTGQAIACGNLGLIYQARGDLDEAERMQRKSLEINERLGRQEGMAAAYGNLGLIYRTRRNLDEAERMHRKSLEINEQLGCQEGMANQYGNLGTICQMRGDGKQAREHWIKSRDLFARVGMPHRVKKVQGLIDELDAAGESGAADE